MSEKEEKEEKEKKEKNVTVELQKVESTNVQKEMREIQEAVVQASNVNEIQKGLVSASGVNQARKEIEQPKKQTESAESGKS